jgi:hypothetical protein
MPTTAQPLNLNASTLETIRQRQVILLDTSVWIRLADGRTSKANELRERLTALVSKEIAFCPLCAPTIWELRKQKTPSLLRTAELMEQLSLNVSFRGLDQLFDREVAHLINYLLTGEFSPLDPSDKFGPVLSYMDKGVALNIDFSLSNKQVLQQQLDCVIQNMSITQLVARLGDQSSPNIDTRGCYQASSKARAQIAGKSKSKALRVEQEDAARRILIPKFNAQRRRHPMSDQLIMVERMELMPMSKKYGDATGHILNFMPALYAYVQMLTVSGYDLNRKDKANDFYDREVLVYGLSYSTIFAACDGWIESLVTLSREARYPGVFKFSKNLDELNGLIEELATTYKQP